MAKIIKVSAAYTSTTSDDGALLLVDASGGAVTITLPLAVEIGELTIRKTDTSDNAVTIAVKGTNTIDGGTTSVTVSEGNSSVVIISDREIAYYTRGDKYKLDYRLLTATGNILASDLVVGVSGTAEVVATLPSASVVPAGRQFLFHGEATAAAAFVLSGAGTDTVDAVVALTVDQQTGSLHVYSNGTVWRTFPSDKL